MIVRRNLDLGYFLGIPRSAFEHIIKRFGNVAVTEITIPGYELIQLRLDGAGVIALKEYGGTNSGDQYGGGSTVALLSALPKKVPDKDLLEDPEVIAFGSVSCVLIGPNMLSLRADAQFGRGGRFSFIEYGEYYPVLRYLLNRFHVLRAGSFPPTFPVRTQK